MDTTAKIEELLGQKYYLLDGEDEGLPNYGLVADSDALEEALALAKSCTGQLSVAELDHIKCLLRLRMHEILVEPVDITDEQYQEHGFNMMDWDESSYAYQEQECAAMTAVDILLDPFLCDDQQAQLIEILSTKDITPDVRKIAAKQLGSLDSYTVNEASLVALMGLFDDYQGMDHSYQSGYFDHLLRVLTQHMMWDERIVELLKRLKQYEYLNRYCDYSRRALDWYLAIYAQQGKDGQRDILMALNHRWKEKGGLLEFCLQQYSLQQDQDLNACLLTILFKNFASHSQVVRLIRKALAAQRCGLSEFEYLPMLQYYSDQDIPEKRDILERNLLQRCSHMDKCIEAYCSSYGLDDRTLAIFERCLREYKDSYRYQLLNIFVRHTPHNETMRQWLHGFMEQPIREGGSGVLKASVLPFLGDYREHPQTRMLLEEIAARDGKGVMQWSMQDQAREMLNSDRRLY